MTPFDGFHLLAGFSYFSRVGNDNIARHGQTMVRVKALIRMRYLTNNIFRVVKIMIKVFHLMFDF